MRYILVIVCRLSRWVEEAPTRTHDHKPESHEAMLFGLDPAKSVPANEGTDHTISQDAEQGMSTHDECLGPVSETLSSTLLEIQVPSRTI